MRRRTMRRQYGGSLAEFGPVLWLFLILIVIPLLDLISFGSAVGTVMLVSTFGAKNVAGAMTWGDAQAALTKTESDMTGFLKFAKTTPGYGATGTQLAVSVSRTDGSGSPSGSPFTAPGSIPISPADPSDSTGNTPQYNQGNCVYQYLVTAKYNCMPLFNFSGTPLLNNVPALGQPVPVTFTSTATVEHVDGLNTSTTSKLN